MRIDLNGIKEEDKVLANSLINKFKAGDFCIGNPGEGLKQQLSKLELEQDKRKAGKLEWGLKDPQLETDIALTKAGIIGEEQLAEYLAILCRGDDKLSGIVFFTSLSYKRDYQQEEEYIPDTDFILVYGKNVLIIDAKNIKTSPFVEITLEDGFIKTVEKGKELIPVKRSTPVWKQIFKEKGIEYDSMTGYVCIVNDTGALIESSMWYDDLTLIHISNLRQVLGEWVDWCNEHYDNILSLKMLTELAKGQILKETTGLDLSLFRQKFGV
jgi:hypothetical protein